MQFTTITKEEILALTNQAKRAGFLVAYQKWSKVLEVPELNQKFYGCILPDARWIIAKEERPFKNDEKYLRRNEPIVSYYCPHDGVGCAFESFKTSEFTLIGELKKLKVRIEEDK